ncbi:MAG: metallopeptidase family protein [Actinomycetota bacterium]
MGRREFEGIVADAVDEVPAPFAAALAHVAIVVEDEDPDDPDLYGVYHGAPLSEPDARHGALPPRIAIYMRPLVEDFPDRDELREEIRITVLHEIGHHLGMDERHLDDLGYG